MTFDDPQMMLTPAATVPRPMTWDDVVGSYVASVSTRLQREGYETEADAAQARKFGKLIPYGEMQFYQVARGHRDPNDRWKVIGAGLVVALGWGCIWSGSSGVAFFGVLVLIAGLFGLYKLDVGRRALVFHFLFSLIAVIWYAIKGLGSGEVFFCLFPANNASVSSYQSACRLSAQYAIDHRLSGGQVMCVPVGVATSGSMMNIKAAVHQTPREVKVGILTKRKRVTLSPAFADLTTGTLLCADKFRPILDITHVSPASSSTMIDTTSTYAQPDPRF